MEAALETRRFLCGLYSIILSGRDAPVPPTSPIRAEEVSMTDVSRKRTTPSDSGRGGTIVPNVAIWRVLGCVSNVAWGAGVRTSGVAAEAKQGTEVPSPVSRFFLTFLCAAPRRRPHAGLFGGGATNFR